MVFLETHRVTVCVMFRTFSIRSSYIKEFSTAIGTMAIESLQQASSVKNHSNLFSEKMPMNLRSGVPLTSDLVTGHSFFLIRALASASTIWSVWSQVSQVYSPSSRLCETMLNLSKGLVIFYCRSPRNGWLGIRQACLLKPFHTVSQLRCAVFWSWCG